MSAPDSGTALSAVALSSELSSVEAPALILWRPGLDQNRGCLELDQGFPGLYPLLCLNVRIQYVHDSHYTRYNNSNQLGLIHRKIIIG